jgi:hypothetical protein
MSTASRNCLCEQLKEVMHYIKQQFVIDHMQATATITFVINGEQKELFIDYKIKCE